MSSAPENDDFPTRVELPDHASAYFSPKPLPAVSDHRTLETAAVRLHPSLDFDGADTQRLPVAPFLEDTVDRNAKTVLVRAIAPRRRSRAVLGVIGIGAVCLGGVFVWALYGNGPDTAQDAEGASTASASIPTVSSKPRLAGAKAASHPVRAIAGPQATSGSVASGVAISSRSPAPSNTASATTTTPARAKPLARTAPVGQPARSAAPANEPATTPESTEPQREPPKASTSLAPSSPEPAPKSWVKDDAPKSWVR